MLQKRILPILVFLFLILTGCGLTTRHGLVSEVEARSLKDVFQRVNPAVVVIVTKEGAFSGAMPDSPLPRGSLGSGVVVSKDGLVMTAAHVVEVADEVSVHFLDGGNVTAKVVNAALQADVALLKLEIVPENLHAAVLGDSDQVSIGDEVFVVGAPYGIDHTLTVGYMSGRRKSIGVCNQLTPIEFLQTDAAINMGNSGGPMFSVDGKLIGIVSRILSQSGGSEGLGFATSINTAKELLSDQASLWIGLEAYLVAGELAKALNVPQEAGLLVQRVANDSPGSRLGLRPGTVPIRIGREQLFIGGDVILEVQGIPISSDVKETCDIRDSMGGLKDGERIEMKVLRGGKIITLNMSK